VTTKEKRLFIIGVMKVLEFHFGSNQLIERVPMKEKRKIAAVVYEPNQNKIYVMGG